MKVLETISAMREWTHRAHASGRSVGFVPTMGALHQGHLALAERAGAENHLLVCSIFVNPIQFNKPEDLERYPRTLEEDLAKLRGLDCDAVFTPTTQEMYPEPETTRYNFGILDKVMEGRFRPGHFNGVAIVVHKLFDMVKPHKAYFGQKDYQQLQVIRALVQMERLPVEVVACPTVREADGLAMSSRNVRLGKNERQAAPLIYKTLLGMRDRCGPMDLASLTNWGRDQINANPFLEVEYLDIVHAERLTPVAHFNPSIPLVVCTAVYAGNIRLIDNIQLND